MISLCHQLTDFATKWDGRWEESAKGNILIASL
jgi:hypothetical protein